MTSSTMRPATIRSKFPTSVRYARVPVLAQAAINSMLTKRGSTLMHYYMSEQDGFAPSAKEVYLYTGLAQPKMIAARKELHSKGFINYDREANTITILWPHIIEMGKVAIMLAENKDCPVKETMQGGAFNFHDKKPKMRDLMREYWDEDANPETPDITCDDYIKANGKYIEGLTEEEYQRWLATGWPFPTDRPISEDYVEPHELPEVGEGLISEEDLEWLDVPPNNIEDYPKEGEFFIEGLTKEEYDSWVAAGIPFID